jgi:hypothetical protein
MQKIETFVFTGLFKESKLAEFHDSIICIEHSTVY